MYLSIREKLWLVINPIAFFSSNKKSQHDSLQPHFSWSSPKVSKINSLWNTETYAQKVRCIKIYWMNSQVVSELREGILAPIAKKHLWAWKSVEEMVPEMSRIFLTEGAQLKALAAVVISWISKK